MVPLPGPLPPETIMIQESLGPAVQVQLASVVRVMSCGGVPATPKVRLPGATDTCIR